VRGRKPLAPTLKIAEGNRSKRAGNNTKSVTIPESLAKPLECPQWLAPDARAVWVELVPKLESLGFVLQTDVRVLATFCTLCARLQKLEAWLSVNGSTYRVKGKSGDAYSRQRPEATLANSLAALLLRYADAIGATPVSRNRITPARPAQTTSGPRLLDGPRIAPIARKDAT